MNVLIAGGFWAIAKFMVLLCCAIIFIIRAIYFSIKSYYVSDKKFMEEYIDSIKGLDILDKKLEDITSESE